MTTKPRPAALDYTVTTRTDRPPRIGDTIQLGKQAYTVTALRVRVELRPVRDDADDDSPEYE